MLTALCLCAALIGPSAARADDFGISDPALAARADQFVTSFWPRLSLDNLVILNFLQSAVGDEIYFYGEMTSHHDFMSIQSKNLERWPTRSYVLQPGTLTTFCDGATGVCHVSGIASWDLSSQLRNARSTGSANFDFLLQCGQKNAQDGCTMIEESSAVISRRLSKLRH